MQKSVAESTETVRCKWPTCSEHDRQLVQIFLDTCKRGQFAHDPGWLPQEHSNVEAIASDPSGATIAIEHTRIFAFAGHKEQEELLRPIAELLEGSPKLRLPGIHFDIRFYAPFLGKRLAGKRGAVIQELLAWATKQLPILEPRLEEYNFEIPIPLERGKFAKIKVDVDVWRRPPHVAPVSVSGYLPREDCLMPLLCKALADKLPKLAKASAARRVLMFELPTTDSEVLILEKICSARRQFELLDCIDELVFAKTFGLKSEGVTFFYTWDIRRQSWTEYVKAVLQPQTGDHS